MATIDRLNSSYLSVDIAGKSYRGATLANLRAPPFSVTDPDLLSAIKNVLKSWVDEEAERLRSSIVTPGSGQAMEYQEAYTQARAALAATPPLVASDFPMLAVTIGIDIDPKTGKAAADVLGVARGVKAAYEGFLEIGAPIRGARLSGKREVDAAATIEGACAAVDAISWPSLS